MGCTVAGTAWSALTFARLSATVDDALRSSQEKIDRSAELAGALEREDDALLLVLGSLEGEQARRDLEAARARCDESSQRLQAVLAPEGGQLARQLRDQIDSYRAAGSRAIEEGKPASALDHYHREVNPRLREAVATCARIHEENVSSLRQAGVRARDQAARATWVVAVALVVAVLLAAGGSFWLARSILVPVRALTESVEAVRLGDFDRRVPATSSDELGELAAGFNRMAESLGEYHASSLGDLLTAKMTLESTLDALPDAVLVIDPDGVVVARNPPAEALLNALGASEAQRFTDLPLRPEQRSAIEIALAGQLAARTRTDFEHALHVTLGGSLHRFLLTALPIPEFAPRRFGAVVVLDDVTEFVRLDELRGELIGMASHELKSPLTSLQLNLLLLAEEATSLPPAQRELLDAALGGCKDLAATIDGLLDLTRAEAGQLRLELGSIELSAVLDQVVRGLRSRFDSARVGLRVVREAERTAIRGDAARLGNVLTNLLTNALKYSPPGGAVTVRLGPGPPGKGGAATLQLTVTDEGPGVPAEFRERVFEKFFRVEHHQGGGGKRPRGTGLGLYLSREIVKAHGGSIRCEAGEDGRGTRMVVVLPAAPVTA